MQNRCQKIKRMPCLCNTEWPGYNGGKKRAQPHRLDPWKNGMQKCSVVAAAALQPHANHHTRVTKNKQLVSVV